MIRKRVMAHCADISSQMIEFFLCGPHLGKFLSKGLPGWLPELSGFSGMDQVQRMTDPAVRLWHIESGEVHGRVPASFALVQRGCARSSE